MLFSQSRLNKFPIFLKLPFGAKAAVTVGDFSSFGVFSEVIDEEVYEIYWKAKIYQSPIIIDVGAHQGFFTLKMAKKIGNKGRIFAIEPDPYNFNKLIKNIANNRYQNRIVPLRLALGSTNGVGKLYSDRICSTRSTLYVEQSSMICSLTDVEIRSLDMLVAREGLQEIDFLKIDAEGAEVEIVNGAKTSFSKNIVKSMVIEAHLISEDMRHDLTKMLRSKGYAVSDQAGYIYAWVTGS